MLILALETSGEICSVALSEGPELLSVLRFRHERRLSERMPILVDALLKDRQVALTDIQGIAVGRGPGSFTGVRVAVTMAKVWGLALEVPVIGVSSLDALVEPYAPMACGAVAAVTPTRRTESIVAYYQAGMANPVGEPTVVPDEEVVGRAEAAIPDERLRFVLGENASRIPLPGQTNRIRCLTASSAADAVARLAWLRFVREDTDNTDTLEPLYVAPSPVG
ncbi:MAG: tRNA (adenosine(37)-N6)-threonylcarbamoyltransferase complex dimerization subunit type 1 TsaB [Armatimonadaceae bacterium]